MKRLTLLTGILVVSVATIGCKTDEGRCEDICATLDDCDSLASSIDVDECIEDCVDDVDGEDDRCVESFEALADCFSDADRDCKDALGEAFNDGVGYPDGDCDSEFEDLLSDCDDL